MNPAKMNPLEFDSQDGPCVWALGGGKGGVGKSMITANLAIALARRGRRCIALDADLGGGNLHTILGVRKPHRTLSDFLNREVSSLSDVLCETSIPNLSLVSGSRAFLEMANPKHSQKERLLRQIRTLDADDLLLDLSAGSAFNVLDFFLEARRGIVVVVPEPTSLENAYHFLKAAFFRSLSRATREPQVRHVVEQVMKERDRLDVHSPRELIARVAALDRVAGRALEDQARTFQPLLIVNQARTPDHRRMGDDIALACREYLGTDVEYLGAVARDEQVHAAVSQRRPALELHPYCSFSRDVEALAARLLDVEAPDLAESDELRRAYLHKREVFGEESLATHGLLSEGERRTQLARFESSYAERMSRASQQRTSAPAQPEPALPPPDLEQPGGYLKRCRELLGLTLRNAYERTRLSTLEAIESEAWDALPPEPYLSRHVVAYARALGVRDVEAVAASMLRRSRLPRGQAAASVEAGAKAR
jgi:flagellar biosynthesis protein FlhG